jgi:LacI family transcriptional regulator
MIKKVTVYDIAKKLEISASTVSRVLNNSSLISSEKSDLILKTAKEMGYEKRNIKRPGSRAILNIILFLPWDEEPQYHMFYDSAELVFGIRYGFGNTKINIITELNDGQSSALENRKVGDIDGVIFAFTDPSSLMSATLEKRNIPFILLNRKDERFNYISLHNDEAMERFFSLVKGNGAELRPFYIGLKAAEKVNSYRKKAFLEQCESEGITKFEMIDIASFDEINGELITFIQNRDFNCIVCFNDIVAVSVISASRSSGLSIPEDFSVTGFDNSPLRNVFPIKVDTIDLEVKKMGEKAGEWFFNRIINKDEEPIQLELHARHIKGNTIR